MDEEIQDMIKDCLNRKSRLTAWENNFMNEISAQLSKKKPISEKQASRIEIIWERVTS